VSEASPATGAGTEAGRGKKSSRRKKRRDVSEPTSVSLMHARWRAFSWAAGGIALGLLLLIKLGAVGKGIGVILILASLLAVRNFVLTLLHEPGKIDVDTSEITLPRGLCRAGPVTMPVDKLRHAYFLRRAVPWTRTGPLLIVETSDGTFQYPRDWFATDSDQRRIAAALNHRLGRS
jgi:hypothetical protein